MPTMQGGGGSGGESGSCGNGSAAPALQQMLQASVQSLQWTYSLLWQMCPQQGVLVWTDGYYNGAIKTRKMVQSVEATADEACLQRSQQLRELYESLSMGEANQPARRPCAALSPEDLTESEWFYLMCISFFFPPGVGLPGKAFERQKYVWLSGASEVDSKVFSRAILAKGAQIQTVVCIPLADGVLEIGTTNKVVEDPALIHHVKGFFTGHHAQLLPNATKPALSEHSTSNPSPSAGKRLFRSPSLLSVPPAAAAEDSHMYHEDDDDEEEEEEEEDGEEEDGGGTESESESGADAGNRGADEVELVGPCPVAEAERSELMQMEMPEEVRLGSPDDCSNNLDVDLHVMAVGYPPVASEDWPLLHHDPTNDGFPPSSGATAIQSLSQEDAHYSHTVSTIMQQNSGRGVEPCSGGYLDLDHPRPLAFSSWCCDGEGLPRRAAEGASQWLLKQALRSFPDPHGGYNKGETSPRGRDGEGRQRFRKGTPQEELISASHVMAERRRREKLNERFIVLRSLVPCVTKMDKASILGDTIDYLKQLLRRIQEMESQMKQMEGERRARATTQVFRPSPVEQSSQTNSSSPPPDSAQHLISDRSRTTGSNTKKLRVSEGGSGPAKDKGMEETNIQVSIIEADALLELQCPNRDGLLLKIMQVINEVGLEATAVQCSSVDGNLVAEVRAKVRENIDGKKASIVEVKKVLHHVVSQNS